MSAVNDLVGQRFGRLAVVSRAGSNRAGRATWNCACDCGTPAIVIGWCLIGGSTMSCGCWQRDRTSEASVSHARTGTPEHRAWRNAKCRCFNPKTLGYAAYGGRGITMCERWAMSFQAFYEDVGPRPSIAHSIDRIDVDGNYEPGNCRWVTRDVQSQNTRRAKARMIQCA